MIRRILVVLVAALALLVSGVVGVVAADWPFWKRVATLPRDSGEWPDSFYTPTAAIDGGSSPFFPVATEAERSIAPQALSAAAQWAAANNSVALLVLHRGRVQLEEYWQGMSAEQLFSARAMSRSLLAIAYGHAIDLGVIDSLDEPIETWLTEWRDEPRGRITVRQLMWNVSGLEELPLSAGGPNATLLGRLQALLGKNGRLSLGTDFEAAALSFALEHEPGARFAFSNANSQLLGVILERATGVPYERFVEESIWRPLGAGRAEFYLDRRTGMPAVYCCFRATPRDFLRLGTLLLDEPQQAVRLTPPGWNELLAVGSIVNPHYGLQIWTGRPPAGLREYVPGTGQGVTHGEPYVAERVLWMEGGGGRTIWAFPDEQLVIVRLGRASPDWDASMIPNLILRGIVAPLPP